MVLFLSLVFEITPASQTFLVVAIWGLEWRIQCFERTVIDVLHRNVLSSRLTPEKVCVFLVEILGLV